MKTKTIAICISTVIGTIVALRSLDPSLALAQQFSAEQISEIELSPAAAAQPALKYRLFPDPEVMFDRNAAIYYSRAVILHKNVEAGIRAARQRTGQDRPKSLYDDYQLWMNEPLSDLPQQDVQAWLERHANTFTELQRAARSRHCDWGMFRDDDTPVNRYALLIPDQQALRSLSRLLAMKVRLEIVRGQLETAAENIAVGLKMAHDLSQSESAIGGLIGVACANNLLDQLILMLQHRDCPNLYWSLTAIPKPLVDCRGLVQSEMAHIRSGAGLRSLRNPAQSTDTVNAWRQRYFQDINTLLFEYGGRPGSPFMGQITGVLLALRGYPIAKQHLMDSGFDESYIDSLPAAQVVSIAQQRLNHLLHDDVVKWLNLPYPHSLRYAREFEIREYASVQQVPAMIPLLDMLVPALSGVIYAEVRTQRNISAYRVLEAIRLHLSEHGKLPPSLQDITTVPVPNDPATGKPFAYQLKDAHAELVVSHRIRQNTRLYQIKPANKN